MEVRVRGNSFVPGTTRETVVSGWFRVQGLPCSGRGQALVYHGRRPADSCLHQVHNTVCVSHICLPDNRSHGTRDHEQHIMQDVVVPKPSAQQGNKPSEHEWELCPSRCQWNDRFTYCSKEVPQSTNWKRLFKGARNNLSCEL